MNHPPLQSDPQPAAGGDSPVLTIGGLARATGIPADTLRTWERRYGRPTPRRLPSGHRRFGFEEIPRLALVRECLGLGQPPSTLLFMDEVALRLLVDSLRNAHASPPHRGDPASGDGRSAEPPAAESVSAWLRAVEEGSVGVLEAGLAREWERLGVLEFLSLRVGPLLRETGRRRRENRFTIAAERLVSEGLQAFLSARRLDLAVAARGPVAVCVAPPGEPQALGLHQAALVLASAGWRVAFLGTGVPAADAAASVAQVGARAVVVGASDSLAPAAAREYLVDLRARIGPEVGLAVGGQGAPPVDGALRFEDPVALRSWAEAAGR